MSYNNETIESNTISSNSSLNNDIIDLILGKYILDGVLTVGIVLNTITLLVFIKIIKQERSNHGNMFKYLVLKCICDFFVVILFLPDKFMSNGNYIKVLFTKWHYYFLENVLSTISAFFESASSLDCLFFIARKVQWFKNKLTFYLVVSSVSIITTVYYIAGLFRFEISQDENNNYYLKDTAFRSSFFIKNIFLSVHFIFRDGILFFVSIVINSIILYYLRERTRIRLALASKKQTSLVRNAIASEIKKVKLTIFTSLTVLFRLPETVDFFIFKSSSIIFFDLIVILKYTSFSIGFFGFYLYNSSFKIICKKFFFALFNIFRRT
jgi:hypothetical protein